MLRVLVLVAAASTVHAATGQTVYAWFPRNVDDWATAAIDWDAISHLCYRGVIIRNDGTVRPGRQATPERVAALVREAHSRGVKVCALIWGTDASGSSRYLARHRDAAVRSIVAYVTANGLDGVNIDDETWEETNSVTGGPNRDLVTAFFRSLRAGFRAAGRESHISWASPPVISPDDRHGVSWPDYEAIAAEIDAFAVMSYAMVPPTMGWSGSSQPVRGGGWAGPHRRDYETAIQDYLAATGNAYRKVLLGIDTSRGGTEWRCRTADPLATVIDKPRAIGATEAEANAAKHGRRFDTDQKAPWYAYRHGLAWRQGWYQDDESFAAKLDLAREYRLGGVCFWVVDGSAEPASTFRLTRERMGPLR